MISKPGFVLAGLYVLVSAYLILTQGLFGESFIAIILGLPWVLLPAFFEFGGEGRVLVYVFILTPIIINTLILYWVGSVLGRAFSQKKQEAPTQ